MLELIVLGVITWMLLSIACVCYLNTLEDCVKEWRELSWRAKVWSTLIAPIAYAELVIAAFKK